MFAAVDEGAVVVRRDDAEGLPCELPARAAERGDGDGELTVGAAKEGVDLRAGAKEVEIDVAEAGKRQRCADVGIDDHAERERAHALRWSGEPRRRGDGARRRRLRGVPAAGRLANQ